MPSAARVSAGHERGPRSPRIPAPPLAGRDERATGRRVRRRAVRVADGPLMAKAQHAPVAAACPMPPGRLLVLTATKVAPTAQPRWPMPQDAGIR